LAYEGSFLLVKISSDENPALDFQVKNGVLISSISTPYPLSGSQITVSNLLFSSSTQEISSSTDVSFTLSGFGENGKIYSENFSTKIYSSL
jgi:hypothetical protein